MKLIKKVIEIGNGAAVYVPKEYSGREVIVILPEGVQDIQRRVVSSLIEHMPNILGVYLYGSYARHEQEPDSDIDILVITKEKNEEIKNALNEKDIDVRVVSLESIKKATAEYPLFIFPILQEAVVLLNPTLLEELKNLPFNAKKIKWHIDEIKRTLRIIETFIALDDKNIASSHIYSLLMRVRVCFLLECLLKRKRFSNETVRNVLLDNGFTSKEVVRFFSIYRKVRENEDSCTKMQKEEIQKLMNFLKEYVKKLEHETKKETQKRH